MTGRFIAVVGPSGVGKDSVMAAVAAADPRVRLVRRVITRAPDLGGEDYIAVSETRFAELRAAGAFCLSWGAHGLFYGIPADVRDAVDTGALCMANLSRSVLPQAQALFGTPLILNLRASPQTLARRLAGRGRESVAEIETRLARASFALPEGITAQEIDNDGPLGATVAQVLSLLQPERA